jgi:2',3'-cyclic-nucleotide 2'-phosphodiesterase (5'-nucleotidase family)
MAITFSVLPQNESNALVSPGLINMGAVGANAESSAYSTLHRYLYTVGGSSGTIVVTDLSDPTKPKVVSKGNPDLNPSTGTPFQTLQSAAVFGNLLAVAVQNTVKTNPGFVEFFDIRNPALPVSVSTLTVGALPDMVKFSSDGRKLLVTNEGEPDSPYTIDPEGSISVINTSGFLAATPAAPTQSDVKTVGFGTWENRRAELINRGVRIGQRLGVTTNVAQDMEPEAIAISTDGNTAWISLQENNAIAVLDLTATEPVVKDIFSAGIQDWSRGRASAINTSFTLEYAAGNANQPSGVQAGGLSGLWFDGTEQVAGENLDIYYANTDRGPNGGLVAGKRQFLDPDFQPTIYKLGVNRATGAVSELSRIGLKRTDGTPLTGLPQLEGKDDIPVDSGNNPLPYDPFGIDSETVSVLTVTIGGTARKVFAVGDEYRGQIALFDFSTGNLIQRYIPAGQKAQLQAQHGAVIGAETIDSLPAIYGSNRWSNRGIEGMAYNSTDGLLYAFMQSPLDKDTNGTGASRSTSELTRILAIDPATGTPVKEHLYLLSGRVGQDKIGDVTFDAARGVFLVMERDSTRSLTGFKHVYEVDLRGATNTLPLTLASQVGAAAFPSETFLVGTEGRAVFREVIDAGEQGNNGYRFNGIPDGIGVTDNGDGTLRVLVAHELGNTAGDVRAHGSKGAYVSDLTIDKATLSVVSGKDFLASANDLFLASADGNSWTSGTTTAFARFCSADLAAATAFRNGTNGYGGRIFLTGEEAGAEGRAFAHVLDGADAGKVYELPSLGNLSFENVVANPLAQDKTVVVSLDDTSTNGQVYVYVGAKTTIGNAVQQAGLAGGTTYGIRVNSTGSTNTEVGNLASPNETGLGLINGVGTFELVNLGDVKAKTGAQLNSESITAGVTNWLRPEDGAWSLDGKTFYFVTTANSTSASRLWAMEFTNPASPELGGTVKMLLNGSEGQNMLDNMTVADDGSILLQEDPGNNARLAKIWRYNPSTDTLVELAQHNPSQFSGTGAITLDEESSGIVDISSFLTGVSGYDTSKYSYFLIADQIHKAVASPTSQVEVGELSVMATAKPGITGLSSWNDAFGVGPELLSNTRELIDHDSNPATPSIFSTSSADRLATAGIRLATKRELFNLPSIGGTTTFDKPEGLTLRNDGALVVSYDNDFGTEGASGNALTVVSFNGAGFDSSDRDVNGTAGGGNQYRPLSGLPVAGLTMPDGLATYTDPLGRRFLLAAGEGDSREYRPDVGDVFVDLTRADATTVINGTAFRDHPGVAALNTAFQTATGIARTRLNLLNDTGDINGDGKIDQATTIGSRSLRIFDDKGNVVFDSGQALEDLANSLGQRPINRDDDKGTEPEMVEVATVDGRSYAFVALERTENSVIAIFDITDPYQVIAANPMVFSGAQRVEGVTFLTNTRGAVGGVVASSEGNDQVSLTNALPGRYTLQLLHLADGEAGLLAPETAPNLAALVDAFDGSVPNTLILAGGDNFIPGPFLNGGTDLSVRDELNATTGSTISGNQPIAAVDIAIHNLIGVEASTIGNHEFDLGTRVFRDAINPAGSWVGAQFPYLSANLEFSGDADLNARFTNTVGTGLEEASDLKARLVPSAVVTKGGQKIGLVGATTQILEQISSTGGVEVKGFTGDGAETNDMALLASQLQPVIDDLTTQGVNKIVLMAHLQQLSYEQQLAPLLKGVDIILAGGSNTRLGDANDVPATFSGHTANFSGAYPIVTSGADGGTTLIVNTDNEYTYLGRLVVDFNDAGELVLDSLDTLINGAYAATAGNVAKAWNVVEADLSTTAFAAGTKGGKVALLTGAVQDVIEAKDGQIWGYTSAYLEGERAFVRNQETNLGNLTADANLGYARLVDPSVVVSFKNGGGIRAQIGSADVVSGDKRPPVANPGAGKPTGGVSTLDIENSLRFNNSLTLVSLTAAEFRQVVEHGLVGAGTSQGRFPQIAGFSLSYDLTRPEGSRVVSMAIENGAGLSTDVIVRNGALVGDPTRTFRMVTLNFLVGTTGATTGGDGYPFPSFSGLNRVDLQQTTTTGFATFSPDGTEQDALAEYLRATTSQASPYSKADTPAALDQRLQNLAERIDTVVDPATLSLRTLSADKAEGNSGSTPFTFTIQREGDLSVAVRVAWTVTGSTTTNALDFAGSAFPSGVATLAAGETSQQITLNVAGDRVFEADETFTVSLSNPVGGTLAAGGATASGRIQNDDQPPSISLSLANASVTEDGSTNLAYTFTRSGSTSSPLTVNYSVGGTASRGIDYTGIPALPATKTITFAAGSATASLRVDPTGDRNQEANETVALSLLASSGYTLGTPSAVTGTILNDDRIGTSARNTITGTAIAEFIDGLQANDTLTGGVGPDVFGFRYSHSTLTTPDRITDFRFGSDKIDLFTASGGNLPAPAGFTRASNNSTATTLSALATSVFSDANGTLAGNQALGANRAALVVATRAPIAGTYLFINDGNANRNNSNDLLINLTGFSGALPGLGVNPVGSVFV